MTLGSGGNVRTWLWCGGRLVAENFPLADVSDHLHDRDALGWADLRDPDHALLTQLAAELDFDPHAVEDVVASGERTKATGYATHTFLTVYATRLVDDPIQALDDAIEDLEDGLFDDHGHPHAVQRRTYQVRKELVELRRVVLPMREVIGTVMRHPAERGNSRTRQLVHRPVRPR